MIANVDGHWIEIVRKDDNRGHFQGHKLNAVQADELRLTIDKMYTDGKSVRIFEIRAHGIENAE